MATFEELIAPAAAEVMPELPPVAASLDKILLPAKDEYYRAEYIKSLPAHEQRLWRFLVRRGSNPKYWEGTPDNPFPLFGDEYFGRLSDDTKRAFLKDNIPGLDVIPDRTMDLVLETSRRARNEQALRRFKPRYRGGLTSEELGRGEPPELMEDRPPVGEALSALGSGAQRIPMAIVRANQVGRQFEKLMPGYAVREELETAVPALRAGREWSEAESRKWEQYWGERAKDPAFQRQGKLAEPLTLQQKIHNPYWYLRGVLENVPQMGVAAAGAAAGTALGGPLGGMGVAFVLAGAMEGAAQYDSSKERGKTDNEALADYFAAFVINGTLEAIPAEMLVTRIGRAGFGAIKNEAMRKAYNIAYAALEQGATEGVTESMQETVNILLDQGGIVPDPGLRANIERVLEAFILAAISGGLFGAAAGVRVSPGAEGFAGLGGQVTIADVMDPLVVQALILATPDQARAFAEKKAPTRRDLQALLGGSLVSSQAERTELATRITEQLKTAAPPPGTVPSAPKPAGQPPEGPTTAGPTTPAQTLRRGQPWEMGMRDFIALGEEKAKSFAREVLGLVPVHPRGIPTRQYLRGVHQLIIEHALRRGEPVGPLVLADYPGVAERVAAEQAAQATGAERGVRVEPGRPGERPPINLEAAQTARNIEELAKASGIEEVAPAAPPAGEVTQPPVASTGATRPIPTLAWRTPVTKGMEGLAETQSAGLPEGRFYALDRPFGSEAHDPSKAQRVAVPIPGRVFDPDGLLDPANRTPHRAIAAEIVAEANRQGPASYRGFYAEQLAARGFDSYIRGIDGDPSNRELIVLSKAKATTPATTAPIAPTTPIPDWVRQEMALRVAQGERLGVNDEIARLAGQGLVARQIVQAIPVLKGMLPDDALSIVRSVRNSRGIPAVGKEAGALPEGVTPEIQTGVPPAGEVTPPAATIAQPAAPPQAPPATPVPQTIPPMFLGPTAVADMFPSGLKAGSIMEGGEVDPRNPRHLAAWRSMGVKEFQGLVAGKPMGGPMRTGKKGAYFSWFPGYSSALEGKTGKPKYLVEFKGIETEGETTTRPVNRGDVSAVWKSEGKGWTRIYDLTTLAELRSALAIAEPAVEKPAPPPPAPVAAPTAPAEPGILHFRNFGIPRPQGLRLNAIAEARAVDVSRMDEIKRISANVGGTSVLEYARAMAAEAWVDPLYKHNWTRIAKHLEEAVLEARRRAETLGATGAAVAGEARGQRTLTRINIIEGKATTVEIPGIGTIPARYVIADVRDLIPSHDVARNFAPNEVYPPNLQPRDYQNDKGEQAKVMAYAGQKKVAHFISTEVTATGGPEMIGPTGIVLNGNGRVMALQEAARRGDYGWYKDGLVEQAEQYGYTRAQVEAIEFPTLAKLVDIDPNSRQAQQIARAGNIPMTETQTPLRLANSLRGIINPEVLEAVPIGEDSTFSEAVVDPSTGKTFRQRLANAIPTQIRSAYFTPENMLTEQGKELVRNMLLTHVVPVEILERLGADRKALLRSLEAAVPQLLQFQRDLPTKSPVPQMLEAIRFLLRHPEVRDVRALSDMLVQSSVFGGMLEPISPAGRMMAYFIIDKGASSRMFRQALGGLMRTLRQEGLLFETQAEDEATRAADALGVDRVAGAEFGTGKATFKETAPAVGYEDDLARMAAPAGPAAFSIYDPNAPSPGPATVQASNAEVFAMPELANMVLQLLDRYPAIRRRMRAGVAGFFRQATETREAGIDLRHDIFIGPIMQQGTVPTSKAAEAQALLTDKLLQTTGLKLEDIVSKAERVSGRSDLTRLTWYRVDPSYAGRVFAHEIGHVVGWLPEETLKRGNILGHIASLKKYFKTLLEEYPESPDEVLTQKERRQIRNEARSEARAELGKDVTNEEVNGLTSAKYADKIAEEVERRGLYTRQEITEELADLQNWWNPIPEERMTDALRKYRARPTELYADALSVLLNNPGALAERAPRFWKAFWAYMERKPEVAKVYQDTVELIKTGGATEAHLGRVYAGMEEGRNLAWKRTKKEKPGIRVGMKRAFRSGEAIFQDVFSATLDFADQIRRGAGLPENLDPRTFIEKARHIGAAIEAYRHEVKYKVALPLLDAGVQWKDFNVYMFLMRVLNERAQKANPWGTDVPTANLSMAELAERFGPLRMEALEKARQEFYRVRSEIIFPMMEEYGGFTDELMAYVRDNDAYVTFMPNVYFTERFGEGIGPRIWRQYGTMLPIAEPATMTILKDAALMQSLQWNAAKRATAEFWQTYAPKEAVPAERRWNGRAQVPIEPSTEAQGLLTWMEDGQVQGAWLPKDVAQSFERMEYGQLALVLAGLQATSALARALYIKLPPGYVAFNLMRDFMRSLRQLPGAGPAKLWRYGRFFFSPFTARESFSRFTATPGEVIQGLLARQDLLSYEALPGLAEDFLMEKRAVETGRFHAPTRSLQAWEGLLKWVSMSETANKVAAYRYLKRYYPNMPDPTFDHHIRSDAGSPDFSRRGVATPWLNSLLLFSNAFMQDWKSQIEAARERPGEYALNLMMYGIMPKAIMWTFKSGMFYAIVKSLMKAAGEGDEADKAGNNRLLRWAAWMQLAYEGMSEYDRANYTCIPLGITPQGKVVYLRLPQDENSRLFGGLLWKVMDGRPDVSTLMHTFDYAAGQAPGGNPAIDTANAVLQYVTGKNPYNAFRGDQAIPDRIFKAHNAQTHLYFLRWLAGDIGGPLVYAFSQPDANGVQTFLEKVLRIPIFGTDVLGRFIKVSDKGYLDATRAIVELEERDLNRRHMETRGIIESIEPGGRPTADQAKRLLLDSEYAARQQKEKIARQEGGWKQRALSEADTKAERRLLVDYFRKHKELRQAAGLPTE